MANTTLYGPTEMIDGDFPWVKRCWLLAVARGATNGGMSWFMSNLTKGYFILGGNTVSNA